jgi:hypothetical protein
VESKNLLMVVFKSSYRFNFVDFEKDSTFNVPPNIAQKIGRNLHLQPNHPLNTIKKIIESYFVKVKSNFLHQLSRSQSKSNIPFKTFDNLSPFVTVQSNFDSLLFPKDHEVLSTHSYHHLNINTTGKKNNRHLLHQQSESIENTHQCSSG